MSTKQEQAAEVKTEKVKLIAVHTHAGKQRKVGDEIDVTEVEKAWLVRHERIAPPAEQAQTASKKEQ